MSSSSLTETLLKCCICLLYSYTIKTVISQTLPPSKDLSSNSGHLEPLGSHSVKHSVEIINNFPAPYEFYTNYVYSSIPVVVKNGAKRSDAFSKWTDEYLMNLPGSDQFLNVEMKKVENREIPSKEISFREFIKQYKELDMYLVESVPDFLG